MPILTQTPGLKLTVSQGGDEVQRVLKYYSEAMAAWIELRFVMIETW